MRSLNPLTLKLHTTESWTNIVSYNNYSNDLHKILYLNKWMKQSFSKKKNIVSKCFVFENNKKIFINLDATSFELLHNSFNRKFLFRNRFYFFRMDNIKNVLLHNNYKFRSYDFSVITSIYAKFPFLLNLLNGFEVLQSNIPVLMHRIYSLVNGYLSMATTTLKDFINIVGFDDEVSFREMQYLVDSAEFSLFRMWRGHGFYKLVVLKNFFFLFITMERSLSNRYKKFVRLRVNHFFVRYFGKRGMSLLNYQLKMSRYASHALRAKKYFSIFLNSCTLSAIYKQPSLFVDSLVHLLEISFAHRDIFSFLENYINYFFHYFELVGLKVRFSGRFRVNRSMRSQTRLIFLGKRISVQRFSNKISYYSKVANTFAGSVNVQVWIC